MICRGMPRISTARWRFASVTVTRLTSPWQADHAAFQQRDLSCTDYVYLWVDGIHLRIRLDEAKAAVLVMIGVRAGGAKELVAMTDGYRASAGAWADLLRDCARRGMRAPVLAVGDGALGFWKALREVFPETREQRCWVHKTANVVDALPKFAQPAADRPPPAGPCTRSRAGRGRRCQPVPVAGAKGPSRAAHCRSRRVLPSVIRPSRTMARASAKGSSSTSMSSPSSSSPPPVPVRSAGV